MGLDFEADPRRSIVKVLLGIGGVLLVLGLAGLVLPGPGVFLIGMSLPFLLLGAVMAVIGGLRRPVPEGDRR